MLLTAERRQVTWCHGIGADQATRLTLDYAFQITNLRMVVGGRGKVQVCGQSSPG